MKILHTADWHLGQKFLHNDREREHQLVLDWLTQCIEKENIDLLIVAGDIFDIGNPPNYARRMYYSFLRSLLNSNCRHIVIIGGNHDSPSMIDAPKLLLESLNVHVIGSASQNMEDQILELKDDKGNIETVVAAVPFLRDRDLKSSLSGESGVERIEKIKEGIYNYYHNMAKACQKYSKQKIPIISTGHLYAKGVTASDKQDNIYIGNMENIEAKQFPKLFDYIALGHIHRAQKVGGINHIRYSGSLIPLSFSEIQDKKIVNIITFKDNKMDGKIKALTVPLFRKLVTFKGSLEEVQSQLEKLNTRILEKNDDNILSAWIDVMIETDELIPNLDILLQEYTKDMKLELLKIRTNRSHHSLDTQTEAVNLDELKPIEVFQKKCESFGSPPEELEDLLLAFRELENLMEK